MTYSVVSSVASGGLVGFMLGLLGGGGSILATPLLLYVVGVSQPHVAIGTGALAVSANAFASFAAHATKGHVWWRCALLFTLFGMVGAFGGSYMGMAIDGEHLLFLFGIVMMIVGGLMLRPRKSALTSTRRVDLRMCLVTAAIATGVGAASGFFGIGGGFLIVPSLIVATGMPMLSAIGSSLLSVGAFGLTTAINYALSGLVDWRLAAEFIGGGIVGGIAGMLLAKRLGDHKNTLNRLFAALIFIVAAYVLYQSGHGIFA